jgi:hypothetical protein
MAAARSRFLRFGWEQTEDNNPVVSSKAEIIHRHRYTLENNQKSPVQTVGDKEFLWVYVHGTIAKVQKVVSVTFDREEAQEA